VLVEFDSLAQAISAYDSPGYQAAWATRRSATCVLSKVSTSEPSVAAVPALSLDIELPERRFPPPWPIEERRSGREGNSDNLRPDLANTSLKLRNCSVAAPYRRERSDVPKILRMTTMSGPPAMTASEAQVCRNTWNDTGGAISARLDDI
jgi:Domain of unknown function (DUF1330)